MITKVKMDPTKKIMWMLKLFLLEVSNIMYMLWYNLGTPISVTCITLQFRVVTHQNRKKLPDFSPTVKQFSLSVRMINLAMNQQK